MFENEASPYTDLDADHPVNLDSDPIASSCTAEVIAPTLESWELLKGDIMPFQKEHFGLEEEDLIDGFKNPEATIVIIRDTDTKKAVGFTYTEPVQKVYRKDFHPEREKLPNTAYIQNTALDPGYIGHKLVGPLMERLEAELVAKGYKYLERDSAVAYDYAANIQKRYGERVVLSEPHTSRWGDQIFFRIKLLSPEELSAKQHGAI